MSEQPEEVVPERTPENSLDIDALWQKAELALKERLFASLMFHPYRLVMSDMIYIQPISTPPRR